MISVTASSSSSRWSGPVAQHVVGQLGGEPRPLLAAERDVLLLDDLVELAEHDGAQLLGGQVRVVHPAAHALEQRLAHAVLEAGQGVGRRPAGRRDDRRPRHRDGGRRRAAQGRGRLALGGREAVGEVHDDAARCLARYGPGFMSGVAANRDTSRRSSLTIGSLAAALDQRHALVGRRGHRRRARQDDVDTGADRRLDVAHRQAALGVGEVHDHVPAGRDHAQLAQHVELLAQPADAGDVHAGEHHDVGRPVERRQRLLETGRARCRRRRSGTPAPATPAAG